MQVLDDVWKAYVANAVAKPPQFRSRDEIGAIEIAKIGKTPEEYASMLLSAFTSQYVSERAQEALSEVFNAARTHSHDIPCKYWREVAKAIMRAGSGMA